jgi:hypothetical protein
MLYGSLLATELTITCLAFILKVHTGLVLVQDVGGDRTVK